MEMKTYNSNHVLNPDGSRTADIYQGWMNYLAEDDAWKTIDTTLEDTGLNFEMKKAPFEVVLPKLATGTAYFVSTNRYDIFKKAKINDQPLTMKITAQGVSPVPGVIEIGNLGWGKTEYVVYKSAYPLIDADLIYYIHHGKTPRLKKLVRFNSKPLSDLAFKFNLAFDETTYIKDAGQAWDKQNKLNCQGCLSFKRTLNKSPRGIGFYDFYFWDKWENRKKVFVDLQDMGANTFELTKKIPLSLFDGCEFPCYTDASTTFNPNANPESTSVDGYAAWDGAGSSWATVRAAAGTWADDTDVMDMRISCSSSLNLVTRNTRCPILFDTSSLTNLVYVTAATFGFTGVTGTSDEKNLSFTLVSISKGTTTSVSASDYNIGNYSTTHLCSDVTLASVTDDVEKTTSLNASGLSAISLTGITKFGFVWVEDIDNTYTWADSSDNRFVAYSAEYANKPRLTVTYFPTAPLRLPLMGVG